MKIVYTHRTQGQGVEGVHIWEIVRALKRHGHEVRVLSPAGEGVDEQETVNTTPPKVPGFMAWLAARLPELLFELAELAYNAVSYRNLQRQFTDYDCDLVFERYSIFGTAGSRFARKRGCPIILEINYTAQSNLVRERSRLLAPLARYIDSRLFQRADALIVVSTYLKDHLVNDYAIDPTKILVLPNAADPTRFSPDLAPITEVEGRPLAGRRLFGFVGSFTPWHGLDFLLRAFAEIAGDFEDAGLLLIGQGPEHDNIRALAAELGLAERVWMPGSVGHGDLPNYLSACHAFVSPDTNEYGSPMKIFEYMATGRPVIAPDYSPVRDAIDDGCEGFIFPPGDGKALAEKLRQVLSDGEAYARMAAAARKRIEIRHNWNANAAKILELAESIESRPASSVAVTDA